MLMVLTVMILMMNDDDDDGETPHQFVLQFSYINGIFGEMMIFAKMALQIFKQNYSSLLPIYSCDRCVFVIRSICCLQKLF